MSSTTVTTITQSHELNVAAEIPVVQNSTELLPLYCIENITKYEYQVPGRVALECSRRQPDSSGQIVLFMIDTLYDDAFGHWVYESAIYLLLFLRLKKGAFPGLKLHSKRPRRYKDLFYRYFGIPESDVVVVVADGATPGDGATPYTAIIPLPISAWNDRSLSETYKYYVDEFFEVFSGCPAPVKTISVLLSPRGKTENYAGNNRQIDVTEVTAKLQRETDTFILRTDSVKTLATDQIRHIAAARTLILMDGSAYYVNGLFARDSQILVVGGCCVLQHNQEFPKMNYVHQKILAGNNNTVRFPCGTHKVPYSAVARWIESR